MPCFVVLLVALVRIASSTADAPNYPAVDSTVSLFSLSAYRNTGPPFAATFAVFRWRHQSSLFLDVLDSNSGGSKILPLPQSTPGFFSQSRIHSHRPGLAGLFEMHCGDHIFRPQFKLRKDSDCVPNQISGYWSPPEGLIIFPHHTCTKEDSTLLRNNYSLIETMEKYILQEEARPNEIVGAILLVWEDGMENGIFEHSIANIQNVTDEDTWGEKMLDRLSSMCSIHQIPRNLQDLWPVARIVDSKGHNALEGTPLQFRKVEDWKMRNAVILSPQKQKNRRYGAEKKNSENIRRREFMLAKSTQVKIPNYCKINNSSRPLR